LFTRTRRAHYLFAAGLFGMLGFHVGVWAVQLAPLAAGLGLDPAGPRSCCWRWLAASPPSCPRCCCTGWRSALSTWGANTVGSAYEQAYAVTAMTGLHAWFSGGALAGALGSAGLADSRGAVRHRAHQRDVLR
jgi:hypothetical protein